MDAAGVERAILLAWYWESHDSCLENFQWQLDAIRKAPDRFLALAPFNAKGGASALALLRKAFDAGFAGLGELNPPAQGYPYQSDFLDQALSLAGEHGLVANFHATDPRSRDHPGKIETPFASLLSLANRHPHTRFIFSHLGGMEPLHNAQDLPENLYYDTAATPLLYKDPESYSALLRKASAEKILFGTDYPLRVFPRNPDSPDFKTPLEHLRSLPLSDVQLQLIASGNAKRLFNLP